MPPSEGETLDPKVVAFRLKVVERILAAGDPLSRADAYRDLFEAGGLALTASSHLRQLIPVLHILQRERDSQLLKGKPVSIIFDGTSHLGELLLVLVRYYDDGCFKQRLIKLRHSDVPLDAVTLAFILRDSMNAVGILGENIVAFLKDAVEVNFAGVESLKLYRDAGVDRALSFFCFSHMFNRVGKKLQGALPLADAFIKTWSSFFKKTMKGKYEWRGFEAQGGPLNKTPLTRSAVRWFNDYEIAAQILNEFTFVKVARFCTRARTVRARRADVEDDEDDFHEQLARLDQKLKDFFNTPLAAFELELQLLVLVQYGRPLVHACYFLESDAPVLPYVDEHLSRCRTKLSSGSPPSVCSP